MVVKRQLNIEKLNFRKADAYGLSVSTLSRLTRVPDSGLPRHLPDIRSTFCSKPSRPTQPNSTPEPLETPGGSRSLTRQLQDGPHIPK